MAKSSADRPYVIEIEPMPAERSRLVAEILDGAVDLHCHSGPSIMPRILDHREAMLDAERAGFRAVVFKDHFYAGMAHAELLSRMFPECPTRVFSGVALNNAVGGINPHAVEHCAKLGGKIVWMPTIHAANHINYYASATASGGAHPAAGLKMMIDAEPLTVLDASGRLTDAAKQVLDVIAAGNLVLAGGHLHVTELFILFEEAKRRGVAKMMVNHPTYLIGCSDTEIRQFVSMGAFIEHSLSMFIDSIAHQAEPEDLMDLIAIAGVEKTILGSDLGVPRSPRPVDGFRSIVNKLIDIQMNSVDLRKITGDNAAKLIDLGA